MKVYIKQHYFNSGAMYWVYNGYYNAWKSLGYEPTYYNHLSEIDKKEKNYILMSSSEWIEPGLFYVLENSNKTFLCVQPNFFPQPWGNFQGFVTRCSDSLIENINKLKNVFQWAFATGPYHPKWGNIFSIPLAFDNISYKCFSKENDKYDICFIGGQANNGFNEKIHIINNVLSAFSSSDLNCAFYVNKFIPHEEECKILYSSKISLNIHDAYQRILGLDTNERTFKSLGTTGIMVSDTVSQLNNLFPEVKHSNSPLKLIEYCKEYLNLTRQEREQIKEKNINLILNYHTYIVRVKTMLELSQ